MSIVVLEGPDGAGKTTIAQQQLTRSDTRVKLLKQGPPPFVNHSKIMEHYLRPLEQMIGDAATTYVMDRWHVGELIYGPLLRGKSMLTYAQADYIDMILQTFGASFFHVTAPIQTLEERYDKRGDDIIKKAQLFGITMCYDDWMTTRTHWVWQGYGERDTWFTPKPRMHSPLAGRYIGPDRPKVLLLGDQRNDHRMIFPFVPERATSGHWLMQAMSDAKVNHMDVGIMNACESNLTADELITQWNALGQPPVITLGANAREAWRKTQPIRTLHHLNHPQYERRFHHRAMETYGQAIKDVMENG